MSDHPVNEGVIPLAITPEPGPPTSSSAARTAHTSPSAARAAEPLVLTDGDEPAGSPQLPSQSRTAPKPGPEAACEGVSPERVRALIAAARAGDAEATAQVGGAAYELHTAWPEELETLALLTEAQHTIGNHEYATGVARELLGRAQSGAHADVALQALRAGTGFAESWHAVRTTLARQPGTPEVLAHGVALAAGVPRWQPEAREMLTQVLPRAGELSAQLAAEVHLGGALLALAETDLAGAARHLGAARSAWGALPGLAAADAELERLQALELSPPMQPSHPQPGLLPEQLSPQGHPQQGYPQVQHPRMIQAPMPPAVYGAQSEDTEVPGGAWILAGVWGVLGLLSLGTAVMLLMAINADPESVGFEIGKGSLRLGFSTLITVLVIREVLQGRTFARVAGMLGYLCVGAAGVFGVVTFSDFSAPISIGGPLLALSITQVLVGLHGVVTLGVLWGRLSRRERWMEAPTGLLALAVAGSLLSALGTTLIQAGADEIEGRAVSRGPAALGAPATVPAGSSVRPAGPGALLTAADLPGSSAEPIGAAELSEQRMLEEEASRCAGLSAPMLVVPRVSYAPVVATESGAFISYAGVADAGTAAAEQQRLVSPRYAQCYADLQARVIAGSTGRLGAVSAEALPQRAGEVGFGMNMTVTDAEGITIPYRLTVYQIQRPLPSGEVLLVTLLSVHGADDPTREAQRTQAVQALRAKPLSG